MTQTQLLVATPQGSTDASTARYSLLLTREDAHVEAAQRLRWRVFAGELGADLPDRGDGRDVDRFDEHCDHLVVRDDRTGEIVGTYRMLPPERVGAAGGYYSEGEFDLGAMLGLRPSLVETGRACVHPEHRNGAVVSLVWAGLARYLLLTGHSHMMGCASMPLLDGGVTAAGVWDIARAKHLSPPDLRVRPWRAWDADAVTRAPRTVVPPLLRGYLRLGAYVCGPPAYDPEFDAADLLILLPLERLDHRYLRFFLGEAS
jgi:putative hemolysin